MLKKLSYTFFLFFVINIFVSILGPNIGLGRNEHYFLYESVNITRKEHFGFSLACLLVIFLIISSQFTLFLGKKVNNIVKRYLKDSKNFISYFNLNFNFDKFEKLLLLIGFFFQTVYFFYVPILFECDAASYFNSAKELIPYMNGSYNFDRGPFYPVVLILTGSIIPGTLSILLFLQYILGIYSGVLFYKICVMFSSKVHSFFASFILIFSGLMLFGVKQILPYEFFLFTFLLCIYFFTKVIKFQNVNDVYAFYIVTCTSIFIRWEMQILFIICTFFLILFNFKNKLVLKILMSAALTIFVMFFYTFLKFLATQNSDHIGRIHMHSGSQIFWNIYSAAYPYKFNGKTKNTSLVYKTNGSNTAKIYEILYKRLKENNNLFESEKSWLSKEIYRSTEKMKGEKKFVYYHLYKQYKDDPKSLVNAMFHSDGFHSPNIEYNGFYLPFIVRELKNEVGEKAAQKLLLKASYEAITSHTHLYAQRRIHNLLSFANYHYLSNTFYSLKTEYITISQPYNLANCASSALSQFAMKEYDFDRYLYNSLPYVEEFRLTSSFIRNCYRVLFGFAFVIISLVFLFFKNNNKKILGFLITYNWAHMILLSIYAGGAFTKYEVVVLILFLLICISFFSGLKKT